MKNKIKNINIDLIFMILISILIFASTLLTNDFSYYPYRDIQVFGYAIAILYFFVRIMQKKPIKIIKSKLDIWVILLSGSTVIPLIFNTYVTLYGTVVTILEYTYALSIYFLFRELTYDKNGLGKIITNVLILMGVLTFFIGLDGMTFYNTEELMDYLKIPLTINVDKRMVSTFGCANPFAIFMAMLLFLNINEALNQNNRLLKALYKTITSIFLIAILLSYSKMTFIILIPTILMYIILIEGKVRKIEVIENLIISTIMSIIFFAAYDQLFYQELFLLIWIIFAVVIIINYLINFIFERLNTEKIFYIDFKKIIIIIGVLILGVLIYIIVGLSIYDKFVVFGPNIPTEYKVKVINNIKGNTQYDLDFDLYSIANFNKEDMYTIKVIEKAITNDRIKEHTIKLGDYEGVKNLKITTHEQTVELRIEFNINYEQEEGKLIVNSLKINSKTYPLFYKILPTQLVEKVKSISLNNKTLQERFVMVADTIKISKDNWLTGIGGDGWTYRYKEVQDYDYDLACVHSFPAKVILEGGIVGIISYFMIMLLLIIQTFKTKNMNILAILFAINILMFHTALDTDMEYIYILMLCFGLMGVVSNSFESKTKSQKRDIVLNCILIFVMLFSAYLKLDKRLYDYSTNIIKLDKIRSTLAENPEEYRTVNKKIAQEYEKALSTEKYDYMMKYECIIGCYLNSNIDNKLEVLEKYYEKIKSYKNKSKNEVKYVINKLEVIRNIVKQIEECNNPEYYNIAQKYVDILFNEHEETKEELELLAEKQYHNKKHYDALRKLYDIHRYAENFRNTY